MRSRWKRRDHERAVELLTTLILAAILGVEPACGQPPGAPPDPLRRQVLSAPRLTSAIVIDGAAADWPKDASGAIMALDPDAEEYRGTARAAWDDEFLYIVFKVASGKPMRNAGDDPSTAFKTGDTVELFLSVNEKPLADRVPRGPDCDSAKAGDYRILMTLLRNTRPVVFGFDFVNSACNQNRVTFQISGPKAVVDHAAPVPGAVMAVRKATVNNVDGFVVEAKIPWKYFRNYKPKAGARLLCNLAVNFSNQSGTATMGKAYWNGPSHMTADLGVEAQIHPENWGWLELTDADSNIRRVASVTAGQDTVGLHKTSADAMLLTPPPGPAPKINGPKVYACGPRHPFVYRTAATGRRPMRFAAEGLPAGLALDADSGVIRGTIAARGEYRVTLRAKTRGPG